MPNWIRKALFTYMLLLVVAFSLTISALFSIIVGHK